MKETNYDLQKVVTPKRSRGLWHLMAGYRSIYFIAIIVVGLGSLARTSVYQLLGYFVDEVLPNQALRSQIPLVAVGFLGLALLQGGFTFIGGRLAANASERITQRLRDYLYDHIQRLTFSYHDRTQTGELLQRATSDVDTVRKLFAEQMVGIGRIIALFFSAFISLALINLKLALASVAVVPIMLGISVWFFVKLAQRYEEFQNQEAVLTNRLQESLSGVRVVKAFARQPYEREKFEQENRKKYELGVKLVRIHATYWPTGDVICGIQTAVGYYVGALLVINGTISPGKYVTAMGLITMIIWPIRHLGRLIADSSMGMVSFGRISKIIATPRESSTPPTHPRNTPPSGNITVTDLTFRYEGEDHDVLHDISFSVAAGQTIALLGSTGSGKTSLVNLLPRFYDYTKGSVILDGNELNTYSRDYLRQHIGIVQQEAFLFALSIRDNITYGVGREVSEEEIFAAAHAAAIHNIILTFPNGYDTLVGERGVTLSGGQKQRVTIARTILQNPAILILDDATSAVDTATEAHIHAALRGLTQTTTFMIAHRIQSIMHADLILVMDNGRITASGTHDQLLTLSDTYHRIYSAQASTEIALETEIKALAS